jgi:hypothetical protein
VGPAVRSGQRTSAARSTSHSSTVRRRSPPSQVRTGPSPRSPVAAVPRRGAWGYGYPPTRLRPNALRDASGLGESRSPPSQATPWPALGPASACSGEGLCPAGCRCLRHRLPHVGTGVADTSGTHLSVLKGRTPTGRFEMSIVRAKLSSVLIGKSLLIFD